MGGLLVGERINTKRWMATAVDCGGCVGGRFGPGGSRRPAGQWPASRPSTRQPARTDLDEVGWVLGPERPKIQQHKHLPPAGLSNLDAIARLLGLKRPKIPREEHLKNAATNG
ncbi:hypothetical protein [Actinoplanes nipponensis]|uniref:hypothetical protein n=1 Tax=Actinoplanes nipponensis TaxID=135950 RepID=UPI0019431600|nr:hypothetical protein [Actinoplanes nipponensis]